MTPKGWCAWRGEVPVRILRAALLALLASVVFAAAGLAGSQSVLVQPDIEGVVTLVWGDPQPGKGPGIGPLATLTTDAGLSYRLLLSDELVRSVGGLTHLYRQRVAVSVEPGGLIEAPFPAILATGIRRVVSGNRPDAPDAVTGSQAWVSVACKFKDDPDEPASLSYFQDMYGGTFPELDHYWRELSYDFITVDGSTAVGWYAYLPKTRAEYLISPPPDPGVYPRIDLNALFADCTALGDAAIYYPSYQGINLMFNDILDDSLCCSWGGSRYTTLDSQTRSWRVTWEAEWGYSNIGVVQHEMGHGFGWPHSSGNYGQTYDNHWDVMSDSWLCNPSDATYGCYGQHSITYHLDLAGWIPSFKKVIVASGEAKTVKLERLARPWTRNPLMVSAQVGGDTTNFMTYEVRRRTSYDAQLAGDAVIIHEVDTDRTNQRDAYVIDTDGDGDTSNSGAQFVVGESHTSTSGNIFMHVDSSLPTGFQVSVANNATAHSPTALAVTSGNGNGIWELGEMVGLQPTWLNFSGSTISGIYGGATLTGAATLDWNAAAYGDFAANTELPCYGCYVATATGPRPQLHWDVTLNETLTNGRTKAWTVHIGSSFDDVPSSSIFYSFVEGLLHSGVTLGCSASSYCPAGTVTRAEMAMFLARAIAGGEASVPASGYVPGRGSYNCVLGGTSRFGDVAPDSLGCKHIHYIATRTVTLGCTLTEFCPSSVVNRGEMAMFIARAIANRDELVPESYTDPTTGYTYSCGSTPNIHFNLDMTASTQYCRHAHFLWARGVVSGCDTGKYCGSQPVYRDQMAKFLVNGFGLQLYGP